MREMISDLNIDEAEAFIDLLGEMTETFPDHLIYLAGTKETEVSLIVADVGAQDLERFQDCANAFMGGYRSAKRRYTT